MKAYFVPHKLTSFLKSISFSHILLKISLLFFIGLFFRFWINYLSVLLCSSNYFIELTTLFLGLLPVNCCYYLLPEGTKTIDCAINLIKSRPRDLILDNDYSLKDRGRRRAHWVFLGQFEGKSYKEYKEEWDVDMKFIDQIKNKYKDVKIKYGEMKKEITIQKKTLLWIISPKNR